MNPQRAVRCETRADLDAYGIGILLLGSMLSFFVFGTVMAAREGSPPDPAELAFVALLCAGYVALLAWVALRVREWLALGDAALLFSPSRPGVGEHFTCRMQFARPAVVQGTARAELVCRITTRSGSGSKEKFSTRELWRDTRTANMNGPIQFAFDPPGNLPHAGKSIGTELRWWLKVRGHGNSRFRRRFRVPLGPRASGARDGVHEAFGLGFAANPPAIGPGLGRAFKVIYSLCAIMFLANAGVIAWGLADHFQIGQPGTPQLEGRLRLGDLRQTSTSDFAAQLDGRFAWQPGNLSVQADSLRLRAWDCDGACPRVREYHLTLWHYGEGEPGAISGSSVAHSDPVTIDELPQDGVVLDLGSRTFVLRFRGNIEAVNALLAAEVPVDPVNRRGHTPLMVSVFADLPQIAAALLDAGANPDFVANASSEYGNDTPLGVALTAGARRSVQVLLDKGVNPNATHGGSPIVHLAVAADLPETLALLAKKGADLNARAAWGKQPTPLMAAAGTGKLRVVDKLMELGADPAAADSNGNTARDYAATHRRREVLGRLRSFPGRCALTGC